MKDLKIRVANEAESKEAQELFFELGYVWTDTKCQTKMKYTVPVIYSSFEDGDLCCDKYDINNNHKEITIQELRDMVNPMKEYLEKQADGSYKLVMRGIVGKDDDIEVPEGCNIITRRYRIGSIVYFHWKSLDSDEFFLKDEKRWDNNFNETLSDFIKKNEGDVEIIWKRHTQPEELPFVDSLNDQYAEIEQVRKHRHYFKDVSNIAEIDVYTVLKLFDVTDPCLQHIVKKALCAGKRGHKDMMEDLQNIVDTAIRAVELNS